jgi:Contractile injection system tape measure protein
MERRQNTMKNSIHQLTLDLSFPSSETELSVLNRIIDTEYRDKITQIIQEEIEKISPEQTIFIEKIEIYVDEIKSIEELIRKIKEELQQQISYHLRIQSAENQEIEIKNHQKGTISVGKIWSFGSLCYFLETGNFYWQEQQILWQEKPSEVFSQIQIYSREKPSELLQFFIQKPHAFIRFLLYFKEISRDFLDKETLTFTHFQDDIKTLSQRLFNLESYQLTSVDDNLWIMFLELLSSSQKNTIQSFQTILILLEIITKKGFQINNLIQEFYNKFQDFEGNIINEENQKNLIKYHQQKIKNLHLIENYQHKIEKILRSFQCKKIELSPVFLRFLSKNIILDKTNLIPLDNSIFKIEQDILQTESQITSNIVIQNAGLVLLHPFFAYLFEEFKLIKNGVFLKKKGQYKAIQLLHYLATNKSKFTESDVILNKLLCGISPNEPVIMTKSLSAKAKKSCKELLKQTILYWDVLKNTSIKSLQNEFIQRAGTMQIENNQIIINIERKTIDILIQRLPWGIGMIKLPWEDKMIVINNVLIL